MILHPSIYGLGAVINVVIAVGIWIILDGGVAVDWHAWLLYVMLFANVIAVIAGFYRMHKVYNGKCYACGGAI